MKKNFLPYLFLLLTVFGGLFCGYGIMCCRKNILFSGTRTSAVSIAVPFECNISFAGAVQSNNPVLEFLTDEEKTVCRIQMRITSDKNGKKNLAADIYYPGGKLSGPALIPGVDNPRGRLDLKIRCDGKNSTAEIRENCSIYISSFKKYPSAEINFPIISKIKISPEYGVSLTIAKPGSWEKWLNCFQILSIVFFSIAAIYLLTNFILPQKNDTTHAPPYVPAGIISAVSAFALIGILWSFLEITPKAYDLSHTVISTDLLNPEPGEQILYICSLILSAAILFAVNYLLLEKNFSTRWKITAGISALALIILCRKPEDFLNSTQTVLPETLFFCLAGAVAFYLIRCRKQKFQKYFFLPVLLALWHLVNLCKIYLFRNFDYFDAHHYSVFLHPFWMSHSGFSPFEIPSTYGAYAFFTAPYFRLAGLSPLSTDIFIAGLILLIAGLLFFSFRNIFKTLFWKCFALCGITGLFIWNGTPAVYPQYLPLRMIFPALLIFQISRNLKNPLTLRNCITGSAIAVTAVWWNPDSGCVLLTAWTLFITVMLLIEKPKQNFFKIFLLPATGLAVTAIYFTVNKLCYGSFPDVEKIFTVPLWFGKLGFLQLPMPRLGLWLIPAGVYFAVLSKTASAFIKRKMSDRDKYCLFIALTGCGFLSYYVGRSHFGNLLSASYPAVILLALGAERLREKSYSVLRFAAVFLLLVFSLHSFNAGNKKSTSAERQMFNVYFNRLCSNFEKQLSPAKLLIYSGYLEALIAVETGAKSPLAHPALEEIFWIKDCQNYSRYLKNSDGKTLWIVNMDYLSKHAPQFLSRELKKHIKSRLRREVPPNAMLMFYL
ncbi:MAG: hypothetical protein E7044_07120 [Lentisphaerae bacterium]|nr:hypothetical protein [Lentisphaerota bacterium]